MFFLVKITLKTFTILFVSVNGVLCQHVVLCERTLLRVQLATLCVVCHVTFLIEIYVSAFVG